MAFTTAFDLALKGPFPAQCQYIASLYHYVASTGDLSIAREMFSTCKFILDRCAADQAGDSGLVAGWALWPDFPEAMGENGNDISSLNNSFVYQGLRAMEYIAHALGHHDLAAEYRAWAVRLRASFIKYLYDDGHGYFISSCSSIDFAPRKHYCCQAIFWITPFARELVSHAPGRIAAFMDAHLRSDKCLLSLPHWDTAWMADGNQLGSSYPTADYFYVNVHKLLGDDKGLKTWLGDVDWFWRHHTAPEAFTPEAENEAELGPDNPGCKQLQAVSCWYSCLYMGVAGIDIDHEGITITPWGNMPVSIQGLRLHDTLVDITITGSGPCTESLSVNGVPASLGSRKIAWSQLNGKRASIDLVRAQEGSPHPVIARADGLRVASIETGLGRLSAIVDGDISGEVVIQTTLDAQVTVDGQPALAAYDIATNTITIPVVGGRAIEIGVRQ